MAGARSNQHARGGLRERRAKQLTFALAVAAALLTSCGFEADSAPAKAPRAFYGVVLSSLPTSADLTTMGRGKVGTARLQIAWPSVQGQSGKCTPDNSTGVCDWTHLDPIVAGLAAQGVQILPTLYGTPTWASGRSGRHPYDPLLTSKGRSGWAAFTSSLARRYGPHGKFWSENPTVPYQPIRQWQIWNEQNSSNAFRPRPSPKRYLALVRLSAKKIRAADPKAQIILGGMFGTPGGAGAVTQTAWGFLSKLYKIHGATSAFNAVALHPYSPNLAGVKYQLKKIHGVLAANHDKRRKIWITELGWGSDAKHVRHLATVKTPQGQKKELVQSFNFLTSHRRSWNVAGVTWFAFRDPTSPVGQCTFCLSAGLLTKNLTPKPAWRAFVNYTGGKP